MLGEPLGSVTGSSVTGSWGSPEVLPPPEPLPLWPEELEEEELPLGRDREESRRVPPVTP